MGDSIIAGTKIGGRRAAETNKAKYGPDFYKSIGKLGGANGNTGGFACQVACTCNLVQGNHYKANCAGTKGGRISRRTKKLA